MTLCALAFGFSGADAYAANVNVNCDTASNTGKLAAVLSKLKPGENNLVQVSGVCRENLLIRGVDGLSLIAMPGAVIQDASGGTLPVIDIRGSHRIAVQGFIVRGGSNGLVCRELSTCTFTSDTVQDTLLYTGFNGGIVASESEVWIENVLVRNVFDAGVALYGANAVMMNVTVEGARNGNKWPFGSGVVMSVGTVRNGPITIQHAEGNGLLALNGAVVDLNGLTATDGGADGAWVAGGAVLNVYGTAVIQRNVGAGVVAQTSTVNLGQGTIADNGAAGIFMQWGSKLIAGALSVTNNRQGVVTADTSLSVLSGGGTYTGNHDIDISCYGPPYGTMLGLETVVYGTTDCQLPAAVTRPAFVPKAPLLQGR